MHQTKIYLAYGSISFFFMFVTGLHGQSETTKSDPLKFHLVRFIEVESENVEEFKIAAQEKTKTFNSGNQTSRWWTYRISDGRRSGQFARGFGDVTAKQLDHPKFPVQGLVPETDDEAKYWIEKVAPLQKSSGNREVWQEIQGIWFGDCLLSPRSAILRCPSDGFHWYCGRAICLQPFRECFCA